MMGLEQGEARRVVGLAALVFCILGSYAVARPATESLFLEAHGADSLPHVWMAVAVASLVVVTLYNRWSAGTDLVRLFGAVSGISAALLAALLGAHRLEIPGAIFALYVWKDLYIVMLIEIFWSFASTIFKVEKASKVYGFFLVIGGLGGMAGNLGGGFLAERFGTEVVLAGVVPLLALCWLGCIALARWTGGGGTQEREPAGLLEGFAVLRGSRTLWGLMGLVATTQVVITLIDFQLGTALEQHVPDVDTRTAVIGRIYAAIDVAALSLQLSAGLVLRALGLRLTMLFIPGLLGMAVLGFALVPGFLAISIGKVASKAFDYSIFRVGKELLYIPLGHGEKTQGKAFVDMMTYRMAKGATSLLLLGLGLWSLGSNWIVGLTLAGVGLWVVFVRHLVPKLEQVPKEERVEPAGPTL